MIKYNNIMMIGVNKIIKILTILISLILIVQAIAILRSKNPHYPSK
jgi:hypothetical protein